MPPWGSPMPMHAQSKAISFAACIAVMIILIFVRQESPPRIKEPTNNLLTDVPQ
jgi:hypothetical protein